VVPPARLGEIARLETMPRGHLEATPLVDRRMLDEGDEAAGHKATGAYRLTGPRHLPHLHDPAGCDDLDATTGSRGDDFEGLDALPSVDHCFDSVTLHEANDTPDVPRCRAKRRDDQWIVRREGPSIQSSQVGCLRSASNRAVTSLGKSLQTVATASRTRPEVHQEQDRDRPERGDHGHRWMSRDRYGPLHRRGCALSPDSGCALRIEVASGRPPAPRRAFHSVHGMEPRPPSGADSCVGHSDP